MTPDIVFPDVTPEEYEKAGSKFASVGAHLSECGMPEWETPGQSIRFPFTIIEEGEDNGKESKIVAGISKVGLWKFKEMMKALGVDIAEKDGKVVFTEEAQLTCAGKQFQSIWTLQRDTRPVSEGGKGGTYTKPTSALPVGATIEELIPEPEDAPF